MVFSNSIGDKGESLGRLHCDERCLQDKKKKC